MDCRSQTPRQDRVRSSAPAHSSCHKHHIRSVQKRCRWSRQGRPDCISGRGHSNSHSRRLSLTGLHRCNCKLFVQLCLYLSLSCNQTDQKSDNC